MIKTKTFRISNHYLSEVFLPTLALMGIQTAVRLEKWGWYPKGGGKLETG